MILEIESDIGQTERASLPQAGMACLKLQNWKGIEESELWKEH